jgi:hypothetical protein
MKEKKMEKQNERESDDTINMYGTTNIPYRMSDRPVSLLV